MTHKMILMSHDFKEVKALVIAKKINASEVRQDERLIRIQEVASSSLARSSSSDERE